MRVSDEPSGRSKAWIWILVIVLIGLLTVPFMAMGVAIKKSGFNDFMARHGFGDYALHPDANSSVPAESPELAGLRSMLEKAAASMIRLPKLNSKMKEVQIQAPQASLRKATDEIHQLLANRNLQFVEAVDNDRIRIVVILPSKDWPELAGSLQSAATKDGFIYRGPSQTETVGNQADSMVAQIEILRKLGD